jgi:hypothetical protein
MMPVAAFLLVAILNWPQLLALFGAGHADLSLTFQPQPLTVILSLSGGLLLLNVLPYLDETRRGLIAARANVGRP